MSASQEVADPPPHWLIRSFGVVHLACHRVSGGRLGLSRPKPDRWGTMCLTTTGRRTGRERSVMLGYFEDGPNLVALAVNAWAAAEPAWWLNLQAHPGATAELVDGSRSVRARAAEGDERARLWATWRGLGERSGEAAIAGMDAYAARLSRETAVVVLEPQQAPGNGRRTPAEAESPGARGGSDEMSPSRDPHGMYVHESGTPGAPAIVFIHGGGQSGREWHGHMDRLSGFHCLAPDLPGHGRSNHLPSASPGEIADLLAELIETCVPARRASVAGVSWGGALIHALLDRHPGLVERAILDGSPPFLAPRGAGFVMALFLSVLSPFLHTRPVRALFRETHDPADLRAASRRAFRRSIADSFKANAATGAPCPTLLVAGEKEVMIRRADAALATLMPHAEAWFAPGLDHCWQRAAPELHIRMVEAWVTGQELPSELKREPAPSPAAVERLRVMAPENWYLRHKSRIMREVRFTSRPYRKLFVRTYGKEVGEAVTAETMRRFEVLLPDIPYIGGGENPMTRILYLSAAWLAMYRSLRARGASVEEAARLIYLGTASLYDAFPFRLVARWQGRRMFSRKHIEQRRHAATISRRRRYPDDWVFDVVDGDGRAFCWGLDYSECAIVKYLSREGAPELAPYGCWIDYPAYAAMGVKLIRTETIAQGAQRCDFRFARGRPVQVEPEFLHA